MIGNFSTYWQFLLATIVIFVVTGCDLSRKSSENYHPGASGKRVDFGFEIVSVLPVRGSIYGGTKITLTGTGFPSRLSRILVGTAPCVEVLMVNQNTVTCVTSAQSAGTYSIRMEQSETQFRVLENSFTYESGSSSLSRVVVSNVVPNRGTMQGASLLTINGSGFLPGARVFFGSRECTSVSLLSSSSLTCRSPENSTGLVDVRVTNLDRGTGMLGRGFEFISGSDPASPQVTSVVPNSGPFSGNTVIVISGRDFLDGATVSLGGAACEEVNVTSASTISCRTTLHAPGTTDVVVTNPDGRMGVFNSAFTFSGSSFGTDEPPKVTRVTPDHGTIQGGTTITVVGENLKSGASVSIGSALCQEVSVEANGLSLRCLTGPASVGTVDVSVTNLDGKNGILPRGFSYESGSRAPSLVAVEPASGSILGRTKITLSGYQFKPGMTVLVGDAACTSPSVVSEDSATCFTPAHSVGVVTIVATNPDGLKASLSQKFTYTDTRGNPLSVTAVTPAMGPVSGGGRLLIEGAGFQIGASVLIGNEECVSVIVESANRLSCTVAPQELGSKDVVVINSDFGMGILSNGYRYVEPPSLLSVNPNSGAVAGGTMITLTGTNFLAGATIRLGDVGCESPVVVNDTRMTCRTPRHEMGTLDVTVTNADGQSSTKSGGYTYRAPPSLSSLSPRATVVTGGDTLTILGSGFVPGAVVLIGQVACRNVTVSQDNVATCLLPPMVAGSYRVVLTNPDGQFGEHEGVTYYERPTISSVSPASGPLTGGNLITVLGNYFVAGKMQVLVGGNPCGSVSVTAANTLTCIVPSHAAGEVSVKVLVASTEISAELTSGYRYQPGPVIESVSPSVGPLAGGNSVTLQGTGFLSGARVLLGGVLCTSLRTDESGRFLSCVAGSRASGVVDVEVTNPDNQKATLTAGYTYQTAPSVSSIRPNEGSASGGTLVEIQGSGFLAGATVQFAEMECSQVEVSSSTKLVCRTPPHMPGVVSIRVTNSDRQSGALSDAFTYRAAPIVSSISPTYGSVTGGTSLWVTGSGFLPGANVSVGGGACSQVTIVSSSSLTCLTPVGTSGDAQDVVVTNSDGQSGNLSRAYTYYYPPTIEAVSPTSGPLAGGTRLTVTGTHFLSGNMTVTVGTRPCSSVDVVNANSLTCVVPMSAQEGSVDVTVAISQTTFSSTLPSSYSYQSGPSISMVSPAVGSVAGGTTLTILGNYFSNGLTVSLDGVSCSPVVWESREKLQCTTPPHAEGSVELVVTNPDGQFARREQAFRYQAPPTIQTVSPSVGPVLGGTTVEVTGTGFLAGARVSIGGSDCSSVNVMSLSQLTCVTSAHAEGSVEVRVTNIDGQIAEKQNAFRYQAPPVVTSISPSSGSVAGGTRVTISGTGFESGIAVMLGDVACSSVTLVNSTSLTCVSGAHAAGVVDVVVRNEDRQMGRLAQGFTYEPPPLVSEIRPNSGPASGGTLVTIQGSGFALGAQVRIGSGNCTEVVRLSANQLQCFTPVGVTGVQNPVTVTNPDGQEGTLPNAFTYHAPPILTSVLPTGGSVNGGTKVTLSGREFRTGAVVLFDGLSCFSVSVIDDQTMTCSTPPHAMGSVNVTVINSDGQFAILTNAYIYRPAPLVTSYSPIDFATSGGTRFTLQGQNFLIGAEVFFVSGTQTLPATNVTLTSSRTISGNAPGFSAGSQVAVKVVNPDGQKVQVDGIIYLDDPVIAQISPSSGPTTGGTSVVLQGTSLNAIGSVKVDQSSCASVTYPTATSLACVTRSHAAGTVTVTYLLPSGRQATGTYTYQEPPMTVTGIGPTSGSTLGGESVTITGSQFSTSVSVTLGDTVCNQVTVLNTSSTAISCKTQYHPPATVDVIVTKGNESVTLPKAFTFTAPQDEAWAEMSTVGAPSPRLGHCSAMVGQKFFVWGGLSTVHENTGAIYDPITDTWEALPVTPETPSSRRFATCLFTGRAVMVWGGIADSNPMNTGALFDVTAKTWTPISLGNAPEPRRQLYAADWSGKEMLIWGGDNFTAEGIIGKRYNPSTNTWTSMSTTNAPIPRSMVRGVWTGSRFMVWGGVTEAGQETNTGGLYDPATDLWTPTNAVGAPQPRRAQAMVATGREVIIWGGLNRDEKLGDGKKYDLKTSSWSDMASQNAPDPRACCGLKGGIWTGRYFGVWGGFLRGSPVQGGSWYDPVLNYWIRITDVGQPEAGKALEWTGSQLLVWGGTNSQGEVSNHGGRYRPSTSFNANTWVPISTASSPVDTMSVGSAWTGREMIVWGGRDGLGSDKGYRYDPISDSWSAMSQVGAPEARYGHTVQWTGKYFVVWGGKSQSNSSYLKTGGRYEPTTDTWLPTAISANTAMERKDAKSIWTGSEMIVWGGVHPNLGFLNSGGRYDPITDTWQATSTTNAPVGRYFHTLVWTGSEMLVFGGGNPRSINSGGRYDPKANVWSAMNTTVGTAPWPVQRHTAIWTGKEMVVFGGMDHNMSAVSYGYSYSPAANRWTITHDPDLPGAPAPRYHHAAVWTGKEMLIWGGVASSAYLNSGSKINLETGSCVSMSAQNAPTKRAYLDYVWTGRELILWGGYGSDDTGVEAESFRNSGARYTP